MYITNTVQQSFRKRKISYFWIDIQELPSCRMHIVLYMVILGDFQLEGPETGDRNMMVGGGGGGKNRKISGPDLMASFQPKTAQ